MTSHSFYTYYTDPSHFYYEFESKGIKGIVKKLAKFDAIGTNLYNFGFGDFDKRLNRISDTAITNNGDRDKVLATVAQIIYHFTEIYTKAAILIKGSNEVRTRLYRMNIDKYWEKIEFLFEIQGYINNRWELFQKNTNYEAFLIRKTPFILH